MFLVSPPSPQSYSKIWTYRCHRQFTGLVFIHLLTPFLFCIPFFLPSTFLMFCMDVFFMLPAAVAAVLCCNTEAEVSLAVMTHTVFSTAALQAQGCLYRCFSLDPSLPSSLCLSVWTCLSAQCYCSVCHPPPSQNSWATSMFSCWGLRDTIISFHPGSSLIGALGEENLGFSSSLG